MLARVLLVGVALVISAGSASAQTKRPFRGPLQWRPCGSGETDTGNRCAPQTFRGVDFRTACHTHDTCYEVKAGTRKQCDERFRADLRAACNAGGNPRGCHRRAQLMYLLVRILGADAYKNG